VADAILHERTGFIIDGKDNVKLAETACLLLKTPELAARMGAAGRAYVSTLGPESRAAAIQQINIQLTGNDSAGAKM
jgi:glycosyltransferase involved in cell wall biosynthesis